MSSAVRPFQPKLRLLVLALVFVLSVGSLAAATFTPSAVAAPIAVPDSAFDAVTAAKFAKQGNKRVLIDSATTDQSEAVANPDGSTTATRHVRPVRVKQNGAWVQPDSTLVKKSDGTLASKATLAEVVLSGGRRGDVRPVGAPPLLQLSVDGKSVGLDWPGMLPAPTYSGATATYADVLPGVDLKVEVDVDRVHEVVVIKTPEAARNPALTKINMGLPVKNATITKDADGTLHARDIASGEVFTAKPAVMWDSSGVDPVGTNFVRGPAAGGRQAAVGEDLAGQVLTLTPDLKLLGDPQAVYPIYVDPSWQTNFCSSCGRNHYLVQYACGSSKTPGFTQWDNDDQLRAGFIADGASSCSGHLVTARSFVEMSLSGLRGKLIYDAQLNIAVNNSNSCQGANAVVLANGINPGQSFNNGPGWGQMIGSVDGCPSNVGINVTSTIVGLVNGGSSTFTFGIVSPNENDQATWKRYSTQVGFSVTYNSAPNQPSNLQINNGTRSYPCVQGPARPVLGRTSTGYVAKANVSDPDGGMLYAGFRVYKGLVTDGPGHWSWDGNETGVDNVLSDGNSANRNAQVTIPGPLMAADGFYSFNVHITDGRETTWTVPCEVEVEVSAPAAPVVTSQVYPAGTFGGGPGRPGDFTFTVSNSPTTVDHYVWKLDNTAAPMCDGTEPGSAKPAAFNGPATSAVAPPTKGSHLLSAWACNRAGTPSSRVDYSFSVKDASAPLASWQFEGDGASQVTGLRYAGQGSGNYGAGKAGQGITLSGQFGDYFVTGARVLDTTKSFTVSAWVNASKLDGRRAVLSQDGGETSGFVLQYLETGKWAFSLSNADVASPTIVSALSTIVPAVGTWTHLTAVYDAAAHKATLYANGQAQSTVSATAWGSTGPLVVGGAKAGGARTYLFAGGLDELAAFDHALSGGEVATLYTQNGLPTGLSAVREYKLDGTTADETGTDGALNYVGATGYGAGYSDAAGQSATESTVGQSAGQALVLNRSGYGQTRNPVLDNSQSFTLSAWIKLVDRGDYAIAGQSGEHASGFMLTCSPDRWGLGIATSDADGDAGFRWATSAGAPEIGVWTHITGVYDAAAAKSLFYVNGVLEGQAPIPAGTVWKASSGFTVGETKMDSIAAGFFKGTIDQMQVWDRPLPPQEIAGLANTAVLRANYQLDGTAEDGAGSAGGTLSGGVRLLDDGGVNVARFDASWTGRIEAPRPQNFRGDRSFTVEAWVKHTWTPENAAARLQADPTSGGVDGANRAAVSANSVHFPTYDLGYNRDTKDANGISHPRWSWMMAPPTGTPTDPRMRFDLTSADAEDNVWTHLTGTYDAVGKTACLYATTDGRQFAPACIQNVIGWNGENPLEDLLIGSTVWGGIGGGFWYGDIRGVRVYSGVLDAQHMNADIVIDHP
ncbi:MAG: hypothetical protein QOI21_4087 [Actinomycetota bacterium]|jgi:hypothetical protein|nr:hypothetical protein [Actinomycetota bacterium]